MLQSSEGEIIRVHVEDRVRSTIPYNCIRRVCDDDQDIIDSFLCLLGWFWLFKNNVGTCNALFLVYVGLSRRLGLTIKVFH